jgi:hypothetical protein
MRKLLAILLALAMVMSLAACGSEPADDDKKDKDDKKEVVETTEEPAEEETTELVTEVEEEKASSISGIDQGTNDENTYQNDSLNLSFELPSSTWKFLSEDEVASLMNISGTFEGDPADYLDRFGLFYDMCAISFSTNDSVQIIIQDVASLGLNLDAYDNIEDVYLNNVLLGASSKGTIDNVSEYEDVTLCGETYRRVVLDYTTSGVTGQMAYYVSAEDDYVVCIAIMAVTTDLGEIESCFG